MAHTCRNERGAETVEGPTSGSKSPAISLSSSSCCGAALPATDWISLSLRGMEEGQECPEAVRNAVPSCSQECSVVLLNPAPPCSCCT